MFFKKLNNVAHGLFCKNDPFSFVPFFSAEELLAVNGFRQMYDTPSGFFERKYGMYTDMKYGLKCKNFSFFHILFVNCIFPTQFTVSQRTPMVK